MSRHANGVDPEATCGVQDTLAHALLDLELQLQAEEDLQLISNGPG